MCHMKAVVTNTKEAKVIIGMMNKNIVAYLSNFLVDMGIQKEFV